MKIAVIGANGQLGTELCATFSRHHEVMALTHDEVEVSDLESVQTRLRALQPSVVVNTAAYHNVPLCEQEPVQSFKVNALGAFNLARVTEEIGAVLVHFSTDYVFDGQKRTPYLEVDRTNPLNMYGLTKLSGETLVLNHCQRHFVVRLSGIYGRTPCRAKGGNFIMTMLKAAREKPEVRVVDDEVLTPTPVSDIARNTLALVQSGAFGLYHMTCQEACSWYEFAGVIFSELHLQTPLEPCLAADFPTPVKRPLYSVLENLNLRAIGLDHMPHWKDALVNFLKNYANNS
ncbi:MAG: dTDP-4-dehydrorhamnose reductase [bacterium]